MAKVAPIGPGRWKFLCTCGWDKREVTDSEVFFRCERPQIEAKDKPCLIQHDLRLLVEEADIEARVKEAQKFISTHEEKLKAAIEVIGAANQPKTELKLVEDAPKPKRGRPKKVSESPDENG